jgi:NAD(P)H-flavin reductase
MNIPRNDGGRTSAGSHAAATIEDPLVPHPAVVRTVVPETPGVATFRLEYQEPKRHERALVQPGQFHMIYVPGIGEVAISVSSGSDEGPGIGHTIRFVGRVTRMLETLGPGAVVGLRGPYGRGWPLEQAEGRDVLVVAGGLGLAPLRPAVVALLARRERYGRVVLLYGARQPDDLLFQAEYREWERRGMEVIVTVDRAQPGWPGRVGVVPLLMKHLRFDPGGALVLTCGPETMMRFVVAEALADKVADRDIYVSLERNMHCAVGLCGHCQLGPAFVCKDGPVFPYRKIAGFFNQKNF